VGYAVCLRLDSKSEGAVTALWQAMVDNGGSDEMLRLGYPPHLSLAVLDGDPEPATVEGAFKTLQQTETLNVKLGGARCFEGTEIVWLAVDGGDALKQLHDRSLAQLPVSLVREHYRVGQWTPHVTLQLAGDVNGALALASSLWGEPRPAEFVGLDLVQFPPVAVRGSVPLTRTATPPWPISPSSS
tara:strand:- start:3111 stop:3668 length:558 start_codon:yes stop_codon:yes gene_type:complete